MNSRCSRCALLTSAIVGAASWARRAISPAWFMPSSTTAARQPSRRRSSVSGTPMSLLKLPCGRERGVADPGAKDRRDHLRHGRLAVAAGDCDERHREAASPRGGEVAERLAAVGDLEPGQPGVVEAALGERGDRAGRLGLGEIGVRIEALAAQRDEEIARRDAARVAVDARDRRRHAADDARSGQHPRRVVERHHRRRRRDRGGSVARRRGAAEVRRRGAVASPAAPRAASACAACAASENGSFAPAMSW